MTTRDQDPAPTLADEADPLEEGVIEEEAEVEEVPRTLDTPNRGPGAATPDPGPDEARLGTRGPAIDAPGTAEEDPSVPVTPGL